MLPVRTTVAVYHPTRLALLDFRIIYPTCNCTPPIILHGTGGTGVGWLRLRCTSEMQCRLQMALDWLGGVASLVLPVWGPLCGG